MLKKVKGAYSSLSHSHGPSLAIWDHKVLSATRHKWTCPALTPASQAGTWFTYPGGTEGWVDLRSLIAAWPGIEPTTAWSQVWCPNRYATKPPMWHVCHVSLLLLSAFLNQPPFPTLWVHAAQLFTGLTSLLSPNHQHQITNALKASMISVLNNK